MCGVSDPARNEFVGHSGGILKDTYTDLPDSYLKAEGEKLNYPLVVPAPQLPQNWGKIRKKAVKCA